MTRYIAAVQTAIHLTGPYADQLLRCNREYFAHDVCAGLAFCFEAGVILILLEEKYRLSNVKLILHPHH